MKKKKNKQQWKVEFESRVMRYIIGILGEYGKPLNELTELQRTLLEEDVYKLARAIMYESEKYYSEKTKQNEK